MTSADWITVLKAAYYTDDVTSTFPDDQVLELNDFEMKVDTKGPQKKVVLVPRNTIKKATAVIDDEGVFHTP